MGAEPLERCEHLAERDFVGSRLVVLYGIFVACAERAGRDRRREDPVWQDPLGVGFEPAGCHLS